VLLGRAVPRRNPRADHGGSGHGDEDCHCFAAKEAKLPSDEDDCRCVCVCVCGGGGVLKDATEDSTHEEEKDDDAKNALESRLCWVE
jgi:hypothetical protein